MMRGLKWYTDRVRCTKCAVWILRSDLPKETRKSKGKPIIHKECGSVLRVIPRRELEGELQIRNNTRQSFIKLSPRFGMKYDILANKEKWDKLIKRK